MFEYGEFKSFMVAVYANQVLALDLVRTTLNGCRICSIEILKVFTSWYLDFYANHILAHDLIGTFLNGCKILLYMAVLYVCKP